MLDQVSEKLGETPGQRPDGAIADLSPVHTGDGGQLTHSSGAENFAGRMDLSDRDVTHFVRDAVGEAEVQHRLSSDPLGACSGETCRHGVTANNENVRRVGFGDKTIGVEHQSIVRTGDIRFDFCEDRLNEVGVVNLRVETIWGKSSD